MLLVTGGGLNCQYADLPLWLLCMCKYQGQGWYGGRGGLKSEKLFTMCLGKMCEFNILFRDELICRLVRLSHFQISTLSLFLGRLQRDHITNVETSEGLQLQVQPLNCEIKGKIFHESTNRTTVKHW